MQPSLCSCQILPAFKRQNSQKLPLARNCLRAYCPSVHLELYTLLLPKYTSKFAQYKDKKPKTLVQRSPDFTVNMFISVYLSHSVTKTLCLNVISALFPFGCKQHCTAREVGPGRLRMVSFTCTCWKKIMIKMEKRYSFWKR